jgi:tetratricopeptide (TPR) repeat protein
MKKQPPRSRAASYYSARHQFEQGAPTVIHHPEEKMTALGRWTHRLIKEPKKALNWGLTIVVGLVAGVVVWNLVGTSSRTSDIWQKLEKAKKADERITIAKENPAAPAANWALLEAATEIYNQALADMPNNRDVARPMFNRSVELFDQVVREAPKDSPQGRLAALGKARALEARNELAKAIEQYRLVAKNWPGTAEAEEARRQADMLEKPEAAAFYKELYAYSPTKVTLPPLGTEDLKLPSTGSTGLTSPSAKTRLPLPELPLDLPAPEVREVKKPESKPQTETKSGSPQPPAKSDTTKSATGSATGKPSSGATSSTSKSSEATKPGAPKSSAGQGNAPR